MQVKRTLEKLHVTRLIEKGSPVSSSLLQAKAADCHPKATQSPLSEQILRLLPTTASKISPCFFSAPGVAPVAASLTLTVATYLFLQSENPPRSGNHSTKAELRNTEIEQNVSPPHNFLGKAPSPINLSPNLKGAKQALEILHVLRTTNRHSKIRIHWSRNC
ncbi:MAG: hypothetical protein M2R45_01935 [Verrucomicrobia subdivision 3 bacterium]|nr:hypothetical protein [Limisphaerales bacterium]MCS1416199.1 hypothetical protein [Limisphaerales bacterium]